MQLRFKTRLTSEEYVSRQAWCDASLPHCPLHPRGGCSLARHGTYERVNPPGTRVSRWYCPHGHRTFSLLPDCLAARFPGSLCTIEQVVAQVEQAESLEAVADRLRPDVELPGAIRWTRRRVRSVHAALSALRGLHPERFAGCPPTVSMLQKKLTTIGWGTDLLTSRSLAGQKWAVKGDSSQWAILWTPCAPRGQPEQRSTHEESHFPNVRFPRRLR
ncbi:MAG: hypothetical protein ACREX9_07520 [Gammaproteobacteria bacterium]